MSHARQQIRDAVVALLTGLTTTGTNVFVFRADRAVENEEVPALLVSTPSDEVEHNVAGPSTASERRLIIEVRAIDQRVSSAVANVDQACAEVEAALSADETIGGRVKYCRLMETETEADLEPEAPTLEAVMRYEALYRVVSTDPETIVQ